jgi:hypothetical protein
MVKGFSQTTPNTPFSKEDYLQKTKKLLAGYFFRLGL